MQPIYKIIFVLSFSFLCVGCTKSSHPLGKPTPDISYMHLHPYQVRGGGVEIRQRYVPSEEEATVAQYFPLELDALLRRYAQGRFVLFYPPKTVSKLALDSSLNVPLRAIFMIEKAALTKIKKSGTLEGFFGSDTYKGHIVVSLTPVGDGGEREEKPHVIDLVKTIDLPHSLSLSEREFRQFEFLEAMMKDIDSGVIQLVQGKLR